MYDSAIDSIGTGLFSTQNIHASKCKHFHQYFHRFWWSAECVNLGFYVILRVSVKFKDNNINNVWHQHQNTGIYSHYQTTSWHAQSSQKSIDFAGLRPCWIRRILSVYWTS